MNFKALQLHLGPETDCSFNCRLVKLCSWGLLSFASFWMTCAGSWNMCCPLAPQGGCPFQRQEQQQAVGPGLRQSTSGASRLFLRNVFQNYFHLLVKWKCDTQLWARAALALSKDLCTRLLLNCLQRLVLCMSQERMFNCGNLVASKLK